MIEITFLSS